MLKRSREILQITPKIISKEIIEFCKEIDKSQKPYHVPVRPETGCKIIECFWNVRNKVEKNGGKTQHGWAIVESANVMLEAEFHAIWISPQNKPVDITPSERGNVSQILFLPDSTLEYDYESDSKRICNKFKPLSKDARVGELISLRKQLFEIEENCSVGREIRLEGVALERHETLSKQMARIFLQLMYQSQPQPERGRPGRNSPCPCGSGKKFKRCCGK